MIKRLVVASLIMLLKIDCQAQKKTHETKYPFSDQIQKKYEIFESKDGSILKDGFYKEWFQNGQISINCVYKKNKLYGDYKSYYENGKPKFIGLYKGDSLHGIAVEYHMKGYKIWEGNFLDNKKHGEFKYYYQFSNGELALEGRFVNNLKGGLWKKYNLQGELIRTYNYEEGVDKIILGKWLVDGGNLIEYFEDGKFMILDKDNRKIRDGFYKIVIKDNGDKLYFSDINLDNVYLELVNEVYTVEKLVDDSYTVKEYARRLSYEPLKTYNATRILN